MRPTYYFFVSLLIVSLSQRVHAQGFGTDRAGTESFQFTKIAVDPRSAGMGNSNMADAVDGSSLYWNPALSARLASSNVMFSHTSYVADVNVDYVSYIQKIGDFAIGASVHYLNSGDILETTETNPLGTGRTFRTHHIAAGLSGAHQVTDLFSYGMTVKLLTMRILEVEYTTGAIDFGFHYLVGDTGLRFAVGINNFGLDSSPNGTITREDPNGVVIEEPQQEPSLPTRFHIGAAYDLYQSGQSKVLLTAQVTNPSDNAEQFNIGAEYAFMNQFFLRTGYEFGNIERRLPSFGAGIRFDVAGRTLDANYSYSVFERLGEIHRLALSIAL